MPASTEGRYSWSETPWEVYTDDKYGRYVIVDADGEYVEVYESQSLDESNAARTKECVNGCHVLEYPEQLEAFLRCTSEWILDPFNPEHREKVEELFDTIGHYEHENKVADLDKKGIKKRRSILDLKKEEATTY